MGSILTVQALTKSYANGGRSLTVLDNISFSVEEKLTVSIVGPSGSGKTTLLGLCAGLDRPTSGTVELNNIRLNDLSEDERARVRNKYVGFIFQNFQLMPTLTALENVMVPLELRGEKNIRPKAIDLLDKVGLADRTSHYPVQLSGGEQQRVSMARAFSTSPKILFADEPTGNLDSVTGERIIELLFELNRATQTTLVVVTHDQAIAQRCGRTIRIEAGKVAA